MALATQPTAGNSLRPVARVGRSGGPVAWGLTPNSSTTGFLRTPLLTGSGLDRCGNSSYATSNMLGPAVDGAETAAGAALRGTRRSSRLAQLTESVGCWSRWLPTRRRWEHGERECWVPSTAAGRVQRRAPGLFDMTETRLSPRRGGAEEKPELRRSDDGVERERAEEKLKLRRYDA